MNHGEENALSIAGFASYNVGLKKEKGGRNFNKNKHY